MDSRNDVKDFMIACDQEVKEAPHNGLTQQAELYIKLIDEEYKELHEGINHFDLVEIADACADLKWVIEGLEHSLGIPRQAVWDEVARSNMSKISEGGKVLKRDDGKVQKPNTYSPPDIKSIIEK